MTNSDADTHKKVIKYLKVNFEIDIFLSILSITVLFFLLLFQKHLIVQINLPIQLYDTELFIRDYKIICNFIYFSLFRKFFSTCAKRDGSVKKICGMKAIIDGS